MTYLSRGEMTDVSCQERGIRPASNGVIRVIVVHNLWIAYYFRTQSYANSGGGERAPPFFRSKKYGKYHARPPRKRCKKTLHTALALPHYLHVRQKDFPPAYRDREKSPSDCNRFLLTQYQTSCLRNIKSVRDGRRACPCAASAYRRGHAYREVPYARPCCYRPWNCYCHRGRYSGGRWHVP